MKSLSRIVVRVVLVVLAVFALSSVAMADVADSAAGGFTIKITMNVNAAPMDVYRKLVKVGDWWSPEHTYSSDAHNMSIEERAGGCWCEKLPEGGGVKHMEVVLLMPGKMLRLRGGLGPAQAMGVDGSLTFTLTAAGNGTKLEVTYAMGGYSPQGLAGIAIPVNQVLTEQITRLKSYVETGNATATAEKK